MWFGRGAGSGGGTSDYVGIALQNRVGIVLQNWAGKLYTNRGSHTHAWLQLDFGIQIAVAY